jgi:hypothetical protein
MVEQVADDALFALAECRDAAERELTVLLNARATPWVRAGATLVGPFVQPYDICKLLFFVAPRDARLIRLEFFWRRYVLGYDLTGQGGPDLDPRSPDVFSGFEGDGGLPSLAAQIADRVDALLRGGA